VATSYRLTVVGSGNDLDTTQHAEVIVTLTDSRGNPSLLETVVHNDHTQLEQLLIEASKDTDTPGVHDELVTEFDRHLARHVNTEEAVVHPAITGALDDGHVEELTRDTAAVHRFLLEDGQDMERAAAILRAHVDLYERLLARLHEAVGERRMATLGFEFGPASEAAPKRVTPTDAPER
jgi:hypothetical protein